MDKEIPKVRVVLGLGNPGLRYRNTRHNLGFRVIDHLAERLGWELARKPKARFGAGKIGGETIVLAKPRGYMNESGVAAEYFRDAVSCHPSSFLIILDDVELPLGSLRLRWGGRDGGHKGLRSVLIALDSREVPRLRLGVGRGPDTEELPDYLLARFQPDEEPAVAVMVAAAVDCVMTVLERGMEAAMNQFNRAEPIEKVKS